ncbi:malonyl-CoA O-methyltransferase [Sphingobium fontiphilum]|uniref:Malonyl-CoA O-methyltransferase n=2 Tax=Sphingobium fontiphilum TaxID=944425 RepID=A0A7W6DHU9_9SPHN|nr:malonyl-CoA O-methyltransferase [Sphingobium fontiphilum]
MRLAMIDGRKQRISDSFGAAATDYEAHAGPQRAAATLVADLAARQHRQGAPHIWEIGCGTGLLTRHLQRQWPDGRLLVTDIAPAMVDHAARDAMIGGTFLAMDGETPPFEGQWFDLILSSLAFQWFDDLDGALKRLAELLRPGGSLIFSTMGERSFARWRAAHAVCGAVAAVPAYPSLDRLRASLTAFDDAFAFDEDYPLDCGDARGLIGHLRGIGAVVPRDGVAPLGPGVMRRVMAAFDTGGQGDGYHVLFGRITRLR